MRNLVLLTLLSCVLFLSDASALDVEYNEGFAISKTIELCKVVVVGRVTQIESVWRENIEIKHTTDVTVTIERLIKGAPNVGSDKVRFMIEGGTCTNPHTGRTNKRSVSGVPTFEIGERILLFLFEAAVDDPYYEHFPYGRLYPYRERYGKAVIKDESIFRIYLLSKRDASDLKVVKMPLELAVNLCEAAKKDVDETAKLELDIKADMRSSDKKLVTLSDARIKSLKDKAKAIQSKEEDTKTEGED